MPKEASITKLIIDDAHKTTIHSGESTTLAVIRQKYWIINGKSVTKKQLKSCIRCARVKATGMNQMMANLPKPRVNISKPFTHTGVDYAGPINVRTSKGRGHKTYKGYIALFICLATKAIHLELVSDLKSTGFIAAFKRFVSRRGTPKHMYSDNGTNFCAANKFLEAQNRKEQKEINHIFAKQMTKSGIEWHFNPPAAPHFGGLWEAGVKSVKKHLAKTQMESFTFEEFTTLLYRIEACLNSRPLCPMSDQPDDLKILTPAHFLTGNSLIAPPDESDEGKINQLKRWQLIHREFWQHRPKWLKTRENIQIGDLVMINEPNTAPTKWLMGRVANVHPGDDGIIRVATIRTPKGMCKRPIVKLCLLPSPEAENENMSTNETHTESPNEIHTESPNETNTESPGKTQQKAKRGAKPKHKNTTRRINPERINGPSRNQRTKYNLISIDSHVHLWTHNGSDRQSRTRKTILDPKI